MSKAPAYHRSHFKVALKKSLSFLDRGIAVNSGHGLSHSYSFWLNPVNSWFAPYPEVTGYTIPTLIRAGHHVQQTALLDRAKSCADWLCEIQDDEGWFYGGIDPKNGPSVFNSAMILFGLQAAAEEFEDQTFSTALTKCLDWLETVQDDDGRFTNYAYQPGFQPAYYSRVAWAMARANLHITGSPKSMASHRLANTLMGHFSKQGITQSGFKPNESAFLHTVAYALRGAVEYNSFIPEFFNADYLSTLIDIYKKKNQWPGRILYKHGRVADCDFEFRCLTGEAQMAVLLLQQNIEVDIATNTISGLIPFQGKFGQKRGALPGSAPIYGPYMRWRYPTWATKFLVDALLLFEQKA